MAGVSHRISDSDDGRFSGGEVMLSVALPEAVAPDWLARLRARLKPLADGPSRHDALMALIGDAQLFLLGEASHGTAEFYQERVDITKRLILEKGCTAVAVEADWPDAWRVNRYVHGLPGDANAREALSGFLRFPVWMWRNTVVAAFVEWLRLHNLSVSPAQQVGFYGLDLYSLFGSIQAVLTYLDRVDPAAAQRARTRYACFDHAAEDAQAYGYAASFGLRGSCEEQVVQVLRELAIRAAQVPIALGMARDEAFCAEQNARLVHNAETYYRTMFKARVSSWNLRDSHMTDTLLALDRHLASSGAAPRIAVWAHNSHLGDATATAMHQRGEWNVGQLIREEYATQSVLVGFSTHHGWVRAATAWDQPGERTAVRPGLPGSWEDVFHQTGVASFLLPLRTDATLRALVSAPRLQRAIGVIYAPQTKRQSHYFQTRLDQQFDAMIHLDETGALEPLDQTVGQASAEAPETFPSGV